MATRILCLLLLVVFGAACANGNTPILCAQIGALAGGAGGAAIGGSSEKDSDAGPIIAGTLGGAIVGGAAGYFLCKLFEEEEEKKPAPPPPPPPPPPAPAPAPAAPAKIILRGVNFDFDKATIRPDAAVILDEAARLLAENAKARVRVDGHTDATGPDAYNQGLSERRAGSVRDHLVKKGIEASRLTVAGYGESKPIASNATREGRALNRRVELNVVE